MNEFVKPLIDFFKSIPGKLLETIGFEIENGLIESILNFFIALAPLIIIAFIVWLIKRK